jgi:hypothetical protein
MTAMTDLSRMSEEELLARAAESARRQREALAQLRRLQFHLACLNYERRRKGVPVVFGWVGLADAAVSARLRCVDLPRRRGPFRPVEGSG